MDHASENGLVVRESATAGRGVFTTRRFERDEFVFAFAGPLVDEHSINDFTHTIQVDHNLFVGPSGGLDDFVNHCCEPNCVLRSDPPRLWLVADRTIEPGEEITIDYATCIPVGPTLQYCCCGSPRCRHRIGTFWELDSETRKRYEQRGAVPKYVLEWSEVTARR
ncbi:MAG: SET domain-containing protein-lysine N-methyltransferase [Phycisphaeraceae bacterium]|nr:MAG: SET domain-containing protein-lysine N-methyltransferase [Phycisphaeraceae bacterium]